MTGSPAEPGADSAAQEHDSRVASRRQVLQGLSGVAVAGLGTANGHEALGIGAAQSGATWSQQQKLAAADGEPQDAFGGAVSLSGDGATALVGASTDNTPAGRNVGSAYIFTQRGSDWQQQQLAPSDGEGQDGFGISVSLSDDGLTALVGAANDETTDGRRAGSAYVFIRSGEEWRQQQQLVPTDGDENDIFGRSVSLSDNGATALVGAPFDDTPNGQSAGSAYVFTRGDEEWSQQQKLLPTESDADGVSGISVSLSGDGATALVGAPGDETPNGEAAGTTHVFTRGDEEWRYRQQLVADESDRNDIFGISVSLSRDGSTALVGAASDEIMNGQRGGSTYVFAQRGGDWRQQQRLVAPDGEAEDGFGGAVALSDDGVTALIGAAGDETADGEAVGTAHVFTRGDEEWRHQQRLAAADGDAEDAFGRSVALSGDRATALIGAWFDEDPSGRRGGSAYVFTGDGADSPPTAATDTTATPTAAPTNATASPTNSETATTDEVTTGSGPGFSGLTAAGAIGTLSYLLHRERRSEEER